MQLLNVLSTIFGSKSEKDVKALWPIVEKVNEVWEPVKQLSDDELKAKTPEFRQRLANGETLDDILPEAFAVVRESTHRVLGERRTVYDHIRKEHIPFMAHFDVQLMGGIVLHQGKIAEMKTGEGKTQVAVLAVYLNALQGKGVHVVTVNDYLARRDSEWMGKVYGFLGLTVGCLDTTEPSSPERRDAYQCDITYGTNNEFGFDYLRDNMASSEEQCVQRELNYAIVDEVDNVLIDEARTPLIISGPATKSNQEYEELRPRVQRIVSAQKKLIQSLVKEAKDLLQQGEEYAYEAGKKLLVIQKGDPKNSTLAEVLKEPGVGKLIKTVEADYLREKKLHELSEELYYSIDESGHSADLSEKGRELISGSDTDFFVVPNLSEEIGAIENDESLSASDKTAKKEEIHRKHAEVSERIHSVSQLLRAYSLFERDVDYVVQEGQVYIVDEHTGRILHGRRYSEGLHQALEAKEGVKVAGENQTLATITFQNFFKLYNKIAGMTGTAATEAGEFNEIYDLDVTVIPTHRPMIRQDNDDFIYKTQREKYNAIMEEIKETHEKGRPVLVGTTSIEKSERISQQLSRTGIPHEVLNAKNHSREAQIISQAGRLGAVTIATNMAGRGTDIVLGGNFGAIADDQLKKEGIEPDDLTMPEKKKRFTGLAKELEEEHQKVVDAGGLHIVGTERHESRRIDNQLRGRAGRQGDPGSSRFFLSLDDDLMRIFGSGRIALMMDKLGVEDGEVISHPIVSRSIQNAQKKVEGRNFEQRKHLKEYDDVMNYQRTEIYSLRQKVLRGDAPKDEIFEQIAAYLEDTIFAHTSHSKYPEEWHMDALAEDVQATCGIIVSDIKDTVSDFTEETLFDELWKRVRTRYEERERYFGAELMRRIEQSVFLMVIDNLWKDHLYEMDHLKEGVQYRAFGQKNPLYEYQREALELFDRLRKNIARQISSSIFRVETSQQEQDVMGLDNARTTHASFDVYTNDDQTAAPQKVPAGQAAAPRQMITNRGTDTKPQPVRAQKRVGRNEPCPCGSGKKYKKCCGKE